MPPSAIDWPAGSDKITYNRDPVNGLSLGPGYMGSDLGSTILLPDGRVLMLIADCGIADAPGQQQPFGGNPFFPGAPRATFCRNSVVIFSTHVLEDATPVSYNRTDGGGDPVAFFPDIEVDGQPCHRWPAYGWALDNGQILIVGTAVRNELAGGTLTGDNKWACLFDNTTGNPLTWTVFELEQVGGGVGDVGHGDNGFVDMGDGYLALFGKGPSFDRSLYRVHQDDVKRGDIWNGEWWDHKDGWRLDDPVTLQSTLTGSRVPGRGGVAGYPVTTGLDGNACNDGTIHRRPDGRWQWTGIFHNPFTEVGPQPAYISYSITPTDEFEAFDPPVDVYEIPGEVTVAYAGYRSVFTWAGQGANDQAWSYFRNTNVDNPVDDALPVMVKGLSIT